VSPRRLNDVGGAVCLWRKNVLPAGEDDDAAIGELLEGHKGDAIVLCGVHDLFQ